MKDFNIFVVFNDHPLSKKYEVVVEVKDMRYCYEVDPKKDGSFPTKEIPKILKVIEKELG